MVCTACNLSSPIITGFLFEMLVGRGQHSLQRYPAFFAVFAAIYVIEPLLTRVYIKHMCAAGEKVIAYTLGYRLLQPEARLGCIQLLSGLLPSRQSACNAQVLATLRRELFRTLLLQRIDFFDRHDPAELTALISNELDSLRSLVFK